jgi:hypothetical protein
VNAKPGSATPITAYGDTLDCLIQVCFRFDIIDPWTFAATTAARTTTGHAHGCMPV